LEAIRASNICHVEIQGFNFEAPEDMMQATRIVAHAMQTNQRITNLLLDQTICDKEIWKSGIDQRVCS
jgi:hypothetical protein